MTERLQKILSRTGIASRRSAEALIAAGRVTVNGRRATIGQSAEAATDRIAVDGIEIPAADGPAVYLAMNKPAGYTTTTADRHAAHTVMELLPERTTSNVLPVGRLDRDSEGLLVFTNDGELAHRLAHPRYQVDKEYFALVNGEPSPAALSRLRTGVTLDGRATTAAQVEIVDPPPGHAARAGHTWLRIVIHEGRNRQVRRMCYAVGHVVRELVRTRLGPVALGKLKVGETRPLTPREIATLRNALAIPRPRS